MNEPFFRVPDVPPTESPRGADDLEAVSIHLELACTQCGLMNSVSAPVLHFRCRHCSLESGAHVDAWQDVLQGALQQATTCGLGVLVREEKNDRSQKVTAARARTREACVACGGAIVRGAEGAVCRRCRKAAAGAPPSWLAERCPELVGVVQRGSTQSEEIIALFSVTNDPRRSLEFAIDFCNRLELFRQKERSATATRGCFFGMILFLLFLGAIGLLGVAMDAFHVGTVEGNPYDLVKLAVYVVPALALVALWHACKVRRLRPRLERISARVTALENKITAELKANECVGRISARGVRRSRRSGDLSKAARRQTTDLFEVILTPPGRPDHVLCYAQVQIPEADFQQLGGHGAAIRAFYAPPPRALWHVLLQPTALE